MRYNRSGEISITFTGFKWLTSSPSLDWTMHGRSNIKASMARMHSVLIGCAAQLPTRATQLIRPGQSSFHPRPYSIWDKNMRKALFLHATLTGVISFYTIIPLWRRLLTKLDRQAVGLTSHELFTHAESLVFEIGWSSDNLWTFAYKL